MARTIFTAACRSVRCGLVLLVAAMISACAGGAKVAAPPAPLSRAEIDALLASPDRSDADRRNDVRRKPAEMLEFIGVRPGMVALDLSAGGGYTTELLARAAGPTGTVYGQSRPPIPSPAGAVAPQGDAVPAAAPRRTTAMALAERAKKPAAANIVSVVQPLESPAPADRATAGLDLVTLMYDYHDLGDLPVDRARMNAAVFRALKPGGVYVVADHAGRPGTGISEAATLHRIEEDFLRREVEAAGFRLAAEGLFLRNRADPRDRETPDPPMPKDEFVLRFVKP